MTEAAHPMTRRTLLKRVVLASGALVGSIAALAITDADRAETDQPLYTRALGVNGPRLVFVPGIGATTRYWALVVGALANRVRVFRVDLLGFGRSPKPWVTYSVDRHIADLHGMLEPFVRHGTIYNGRALA
ncbi:MAG: alpha/beta fold hydrolase [Polaromonas sp.]|nr:alpha/beta fold hydrolase [Gemmatimonadaceae bacterium]